MSVEITCCRSRRCVISVCGIKLLFCAVATCLWLATCIPLYFIKNVKTSYNYQVTRLVVARTWVNNNTCEFCQNNYAACLSGDCYQPAVQFVHDAMQCDVVYGHYVMYDIALARRIANTTWPQGSNVVAYSSRWDPSDCCFYDCLSVEPFAIIMTVVGAICYIGLAVFVYYSCMSKLRYETYARRLELESQGHTQHS